jgi:hypothetical protein
MDFEFLPASVAVEGARRRLPQMRASLHPPLHNTLPILVQAMLNCNTS